MLFNEIGIEEKCGEKKRKEEKKKSSGTFNEIYFKSFIFVKWPSNVSDPLKIHDDYEFE